MINEMEMPRMDLGYEDMRDIRYSVSWQCYCFVATKQPKSCVVIGERKEGEISLAILIKITRRVVEQKRDRERGKGL